MTTLRTSLLAAAAFLAIGSSAAFAQQAQPTGNGTGFSLGGPAATLAPTGNGTAFAPSGNGAGSATVNSNGATSPVAASGAPRADTCFVDQPIYNRAGRLMGHRTVDICAQ
jgi:hypothetical protein